MLYKKRAVNLPLPGLMLFVMMVGMFKMKKMIISSTGAYIFKIYKMRYGNGYPPGRHHNSLHPSF